MKHSIPEEIVNGLLLPEYDIYIAEGTRALYGAFSKQMLSDSLLIYLAGDQAVYKLNDNSYEPESLVNKLINEFGMGTMKFLFNRHIDGVIAISDFTRNYTGSILEDKPIKVVHPYIQPDLYPKLKVLRPSLNRNVAVTVGTYSQYKGQDILCEAWGTVRDRHPNAQLKLVGAGYPERLEAISGVSVLGFVDDISTVLSEASLYVQPSRVDGFAVTVAEAMCGGLPAVVTSTTGSKTKVKLIDGEFITEPTPSALADAISSYFSKSESERRVLSREARAVGTAFDSDSQKASFRRQFDDLISDLSDRSKSISAPARPS